MIKGLTIIYSWVSGFSTSLWVIQIIPGGEKDLSSGNQIQTLLIGAIVTLSSGIVAMFIYTKKLHADTQKRMAEEMAEYKTIAKENTQALLTNANSTRELALNTKENTDTLTKIKEFLILELKIGKRASQ